jgi:copper transport protein
MLQPEMSTMHRSVALGILAIVIAAAAMLTMAPAANAHAAFRSVTPADGATVTAPPAAVVIEFTRDVGDNVREATLVPPTGSELEESWNADGVRITITPPARMEAGTWTVRWRVLGGDGHPLTGTSTFTIAASASAPAPAQPSGITAAGPATASSYPQQTIERIALAGRILFFGGLLLFIGGVMFAIVAAPGWRPRYWNRTLGATVLGALIVWGTHAALLDERSLPGMLDPLVWIKDAASVGVRGYLLAALIVLAIHALRWQLEPTEWEARRASMPPLLVVLVLAAAAAPALSGHAADGTMLWLRIPLDMLHVLAGAAWLGGLVQLLTITVRERSLDPRMIEVVDRYSRIAAASVVVLVITGIYATLNELDAGIGALLGSAWGRLILLKVVLLAATLPLANANRLRHVPSVSRDPARGVPQLRRYVVLELLVIVWVVGATAMLVYQTPPTSSTPSEPITTSG